MGGTRANGRRRCDVIDCADVIGVCKSVDEVSRITTKNNREVSKRAINLMDASGKMVTVTLWGDEVSRRAWDLGGGWSVGGGGRGKGVAKWPRLTGGSCTYRGCLNTTLNGVLGHFSFLFLKW